MNNVTSIIWNYFQTIKRNTKKKTYQSNFEQKGKDVEEKAKMGRLLDRV